MSKTLLEKVWDAHTVRILPNGQTQLFVGLHLVHEVTSPQAFDMLRARGWKVRYPSRTIATVDHIVPTRDQRRPFMDVMAEDMLSALERNCREAGVPLLDLNSGSQGIVHVIGPELGTTQPGMTIACGDSHTSTHGAFGAVAFGIGTSQVRDVLASQCLALEPLKVRRIEVSGTLAQGVYAKDIILEIIRRLGVNGGVGYAYEYAGDTIDRLSMDERMTICNMSIEGGARVGYVNPDQTTFDYMRGRRFAPQGDAFDAAMHMVAQHGVGSLTRVTTTRCASTPARSGRRSRGGSILASRSTSTSVCRVRPIWSRRRAHRSPKRSISWVSRAATPSKGRASTSPSSAPAPTPGCPTSAKPRASSGGTTCRRMSERWSFRDRRVCARPPSVKASIACSPRRASSGAAPAAPCASR